MLTDRQEGTEKRLKNTEAHVKKLIEEKPQVSVKSPSGGNENLQKYLEDNVSDMDRQIGSM